MIMEDKIAIVTGGGSGIGKATVKKLTHSGARVVVADIHEANALAVAEERTNHGLKAEAIKTDVTKYSEVQELVKYTIDQFGRLDIMVNNAGTGPLQMNKTADHTMEDWDRVVAVNQTGVFYCMKEALAHMGPRETGAVVNVASLAGLKAAGGMLSYTASKFAVVGMTKSAALEYASKGIRVNAVCPGYTESPMLDHLLTMRPDMEQILKAHIPVKRFGKAEEIAEAIVWLASDQNAFITGQTLVLDGGTSL